MPQACALTAACAVLEPSSFTQRQLEELGLGQPWPQTITSLLPILRQDPPARVIRPSSRLSASSSPRSI